MVGSAKSMKGGLIIKTNVVFKKNISMQILQKAGFCLFERHEHKKVRDLLKYL